MGDFKSEDYLTTAQAIQRIESLIENASIDPVTYRALITAITSMQVLQDIVDKLYDWDTRTLRIPVSQGDSN